ncbi:MAG: UDP-glucose 4-epimerase GalE [Rhodanobacter sp.]
MQTILVTGGAGYIGSHTLVLLQQAGYPVLALDNLSNSKAAALARVAQITGKAVPLVNADVRDRDALNEVFRAHDIGAVIHFAGLKAVGESVSEPIRYYDNNVTGTLRLIEAMDRAAIRTLVFSSSATVYGKPSKVPITEAAPLRPTNPYGATKVHAEDILGDVYRADNRWRIAILRYFNPVGAHESGLIGEDSTGVPNNLMPYISQVAIGKRPQLQVFGNDYDTVDGTGVRDYIHVVDLAQGHLAALDALHSRGGKIIANLGTGRGYSVLEMVSAFCDVSGRSIPYVVTSRRGGDIATCYADPTQANTLLGWYATRNLTAMCADQWRWQKENPNGYPE